MIIHNVIQRTPEWYDARRGIPSASNFDKIVTPTGKLSTQSTGYMYELIDQIFDLNHVADDLKTADMARGTELEAEAIKHYEETTFNSVKPVGFITLDDKSAGCSPDGLVNDDGLIEVKCPRGYTHIDYCLNGMPAKYAPQVQGQLFITGRKWCDFVSYNQTYGIHVCRVERNEEFIGALSKALADFHSQKKTAFNRLLAMGYKPDEVYIF